MDFHHSSKVTALQQRLQSFMDGHIYPNEKTYKAEQAAMADRWQPVPVIERLKPLAKEAGLWNLFLPASSSGAGLTNLEYAPLAEMLGRVQWSSEVFNCSAPDTGNMETLERYGTPEHKERWLEPLLRGEIRSCFAMTEPEVASSDATNIACTITRDGGDYVINGRKWWSSGSGDPRCKLLIVMGKTDPNGADKYRQQSMILVPTDTMGVTILRMLPVFGFDDAPHGHGEILFENARVPVENILLGEGRGFEVAQGRLGPGRIHHCMRAVGLAERALEMMCRRLGERVAFGKPLAQQGVMIERVATSRIQIDQVRLLVLHAAWKMDEIGNKVARSEIAAIKVAAANMACEVVDRAIQAFGGAGVTDDYGLGYMYKYARTLRLVDGPDEVHRHQIGRQEFAKYLPARPHA
jgi:acyl-CoA dehydrogenase